jgi:hypothetical protein
MEEEDEDNENLLQITNMKLGNSDEDYKNPGSLFEEIAKGQIVES